MNDTPQRRPDLSELRDNEKALLKAFGPFAESFDKIGETGLDSSTVNEKFSDINKVDLARLIGFNLIHLAEPVQLIGPKRYRITANGRALASEMHRQDVKAQARRNAL